MTLHAVPQPAPQEAWAGLFQTAFKRSRNPMVLLDDARRHVDVNGAYIGLLGHPRSALMGRHVFDFVVGGPIATPREWRAAIADGQFAGEADMLRSDGGSVRVHYAAHAEVLTGRRLVLFVVLETSRSGRRLTEVTPAPVDASALTARERQIVRMIAHGRTSGEIAFALHLSENTIRTHVRNAMVKLHVRSRAHLVAKALADGVALEEDHPDAVST
jgi:DNA-binding CsgD family transcriptional regulator